MLIARDIHLKLGGIPILQDVSITLNPGSVTVLMGPNGTGKTSLLRVMAGDLAADSGKITLNSQAVHQWPANQRARMMAVLPQSSVMNFPFLVEEVVMLGRTPHSSGLLRDTEIVSEALEVVDATYLQKRIFTELSGGEKQRVQLARVLAQIWEADDQSTARVLILDEPTTSLDLAHQQLLLKTVQRLKAKNIAILMTLHDLNLAASCADQIVLLSCGHVAATGSPAKVIQADLIKQTFAVDVEVIAHPSSGLPVVMPSPISTPQDSPHR